MIPCLIIVFSFLLFYLALKSAGLLNNNNKKEERRLKAKPPYSEKTIRDTPKQKEIIVQTLDLPDDYKNGVYESRIAGVSFNCTEADKGIFHGIIYNEENNPHNSKAMAIVSMKKKQICYIPSDEINNYWNWSSGSAVTCVGFIKSFVNEEGKKILFGRVYAIKPCNTKFVQSTTSELEEDIERGEYLSLSRV